MQIARTEDKLTGVAASISPVLTQS